MSRRNCLVTAAVLAFAFVQLRRRLALAEIEIERLRAELVAARWNPVHPTPSAPAPGTRETAQAPAELASEWEQAVAPMDS